MPITKYPETGNGREFNSLLNGDFSNFNNVWSGVFVINCISQVGDIQIINQEFLPGRLIVNRAPGASPRGRRYANKSVKLPNALAWLHRLVLSISTYFDYAQYKSLDGARVEIQNLPSQVNKPLIFNYSTEVDFACVVAFALGVPQAIAQYF